MTKRFCILLAGLAAAAALHGCGIGLPPDVARLAYVNRVERFAMNTPPGWSLRESAGPASVILTGPAAGGEAPPTLTVVAESAEEGAAEDDVGRFLKARVASLKDFRRIDESHRRLADGHEAFAQTFEQAALGPAVRQQQMYVLAGARVYIVTATATPGTFAEHEADFETVFGSLRVGW